MFHHLNGLIVVLLVSKTSQGGVIIFMYVIFGVCVHVNANRTVAERGNIATVSKPS